MLIFLIWVLGVTSDDCCLWVTIFWNLEVIRIKSSARLAVTPYILAALSYLWWNDFEKIKNNFHITLCFASTPPEHFPLVLKLNSLPKILGKCLARYIAPTLLYLSWSYSVFNFRIVQNNLHGLVEEDFILHSTSTFPTEAILQACCYSSMVNVQMCFIH